MIIRRQYKNIAIFFMCFYCLGFSEPLKVATKQNQNVTYTEKIYFISDRTGIRSIWAMDTDGSNQHLVLGYTNFYCHSVNINPSADRMAFVTQTLDNNLSSLTCRLANLDGTGEWILPIAGERPHGPVAWSSDGNTIVYPTVWDGIYTIRSDGSNQKRLTTHYKDDEVDVSINNVIVYDNNTYDQIHTMTLTGTNNVIIHSGGTLGRPKWSPDGTKIFFNKGNTIWVMNADGSNPHQVLTPSTGESFYCPDISPDGTKIAFVRYYQGNEDIWIANIDGSSPIQLTNGSANDTLPEWVRIPNIPSQAEIFHPQLHNTNFRLIKLGVFSE